MRLVLGGAVLVAVLLVQATPNFGYSDAVLLGFDGVVFPLIVLSVVASSIDVGLVSSV